MGEVRGDLRLVCPGTKLPLALRPGAEAAGLVARAGAAPEAVLMRADGGRAYPLVERIPVLLTPEALLPPGAPAADTRDRIYAEAYDEMTYYNDVASGWRVALTAALARGEGPDEHGDSSDPVVQALEVVALASLSPSELASFPEPVQRWVHLRYESAALEDVYRHLAPMRGARVLQIGGIGLDVVKFLLVGAAEAWILSPMLEELRFARTLAEACGVGERLNLAAGIAEELPFPDASFDAIYASGSVHHMVTEVALPECARVLSAGGRFGSVEPWRGPGYAIGTRIFGKREPVRCQPLTPARATPLYAAFERARIAHHGALTRYPLIALSALGVRLSETTVRKTMRFDDVLTERFPRVHRAGSSVALLASR